MGPDRALRTIRPGLLGVLPMLSCPQCAEALTEVGDSVVGCPGGHRFDVARQGYLSLLGSRSRTDTGDSADMVAARGQFLGAGHYGVIARAVAERAAAGPVLEIGAGTAYYLAAAVDAVVSPDAVPTAVTIGLALDSSRYAARRAAAAHPRIGSVVADAWSALPVLTGAAATVLSVFAPRDPAEVARVLAPGGRLVAVTPQPDHLVEIRGPLHMLTVDEGKPERLAAAFSGWLRVVDRADVRAEMRVTRTDVGALVLMGPSARHVQASELAANLDTFEDQTAVTLAVTISVLER